MLIKELRIEAIPTVAPADVELVKGLVAKAFWAYYNADPDREIKTFRILFFRKTVRLRDLHSVFVWLFGEPG